MRQADSTTVGLTATVPVEVLLAAGRTPLDLNNVFITSADPAALVAEAERHGFPGNCCAWIKGIYATARRLGVRSVIGVVQGDCSNTHALMEVFASEGVEVIPFDYPHPRDGDALAEAIDTLALRLGTTRGAAENVRRALLPVRRSLAEIDRLTWQENRVTGEENHRWLVGASDFGGDPDACRREAEAFLADACRRTPMREERRLGFLGIPPIRSGLYDFTETLGARVVFNEFQRQFAMPSALADPPAEDLVAQYLAYTYPYGVDGRLEDIRRAVRERRLDGLIHYVQSFCYRHIQDRLLREGLDVPVLTLEFDRPGPLDGRSATRIEAFLEMLEAHPAAVGKGPSE